MNHDFILISKRKIKWIAKISCFQLTEAPMLLCNNRCNYNNVRVTKGNTLEDTFFYKAFQVVIMLSRKQKGVFSSKPSVIEYKGSSKLLKDWTWYTWKITRWVQLLRPGSLCASHSQACNEDLHIPNRVTTMLSIISIKKKKKQCREHQSCSIKKTLEPFTTFPSSILCSDQTLTIKNKRWRRCTALVTMVGMA